MSLKKKKLGCEFVLSIVIMLSCLLSRSFSQVAAGITCKPGPTYGAILRTFTTSPACRESFEHDTVVTYSQLKTMLATGDIQLFDVRSPAEFEDGHIPTAVNIPLDNLEGSLKLSPEEFEQMFEVKAPGKSDTNIVFQCKSGNRSAKALDIACLLGFNRARHYKGGYIEWIEREEKSL
uniref:thiosulfate:glutathione sulfurtransferase isoform X1 n=1 Tax=Solea senegalensis TaxID=28829 RepID=UPI001CD8861D|nr:thiosulfate:glutathione sulfurtransferase isoform X1 [Solea senegalensis]